MSDYDEYTVNVREYRRVQDGEIKFIHRHRRRPRRWYRRPRPPFRPV